MKNNVLTQRIMDVRKRRSDETRRILMKKVEIAKNILVQEFHAKKIILFGSLAVDEMIHPFSDIDIIVEGLEDNYLKAGGKLIDTLGEFIDLKPFELLDDIFKKQVIQKGKVIYS
ncbi:MAG: nucleotidyltransferase family protein [Nitrospinota bacterium]